MTEIVNNPEAGDEEKAFRLELVKDLNESLRPTFEALQKTDTEMMNRLGSAEEYLARQDGNKTELEKSLEHANERIDEIELKVGTAVTASSVDGAPTQLEMDHTQAWQNWFMQFDSPTALEQLRNCQTEVLNARGQTLEMAKSPDIPSDAGLLVPRVNALPIIPLADKRVGLRSLAATRTVTGIGLKFTARLTFPEMGWEGEGNARTASGTLSSPIEYTVKQGYVWAEVQRNWLQHEPQYAIDEFNSQIGTAINRGENKAFMQGNVPTRPSGLIHLEREADEDNRAGTLKAHETNLGSSTGWAAVAPNKVPWRAVTDVWYKFDAIDDGFSFLAHPKLVADYMKLATTVGESAVGLMPDTARPALQIGGFPLIVDSYLDKPAADKISMIGMAPGAYMVATSADLFVSPSPAVNPENPFMVQYFATRYAAGGPVDPSRIIMFKCADRTD